MSRISLLLVILKLIILIQFQTYSQSPFLPDRPGFGTGTYIINPGSIYIELGYAYSYNKSVYQFNSHIIPETNIRIGLFPKLELNLMWEGFEVSEKLSHLNTFGIGSKYSLINSEDYNVSLLALLQYVGSETTNGYQPLLGVLWDYELKPTLEIFGVAQMSRSYDAEFIQEISLGLGIPLKYNLGFFAEYYIEKTYGIQKISNNIDIGFTVLVINDLQIDAYYSRTFIKEPLNQIGFGISKHIARKKR